MKLWECIKKLKSALLGKNLCNHVFISFFLQGGTDNNGVALFGTVHLQCQLCSQIMKVVVEREENCTLSHK